MKKSIRIQFYTFVVLLLMIIILSLNFLPIIISRDAVFEQKKNSLTSQGNIIAQALSGVDKLSNNNISEILNILDVSGYSQIMVTNDTGNVIFNSVSSENLPSREVDIETALAGHTVFRSLFQTSSFESYYITPISNNNIISGLLLIADTDTQQAEILSSLQATVRTVSIVVVIFVLLIAGISSGGILKRLGKLVSSMRIVADGDYSHRFEVTGRDEIAELGKEFNMLTEKIDTTEKQRRRFVSDASHELKTPLAAIRLLSDSIVQSPSIDYNTVKEFVSDIGIEAERLQHTTEKLLDLSRLDDDIRIAPVPVDLKQVVIDSFVFAKPLADESGVKIKCDLQDGCIVMSNSDDMLRVVFNLMENAVKYNVPGGKVEVILNADENNVYIKVKDTGIGIPEEDRLNIFSRFYRVDKARSREAGGSGLGLSIVHDTVALYGGTITVGENKPQGSVFTVTLPRASEDETGI